VTDQVMSDFPNRNVHFLLKIPRFKLARSVPDQLLLGIWGTVGMSSYASVVGRGPNVPMIESELLMTLAQRCKYA